MHHRQIPAMAFTQHRKTWGAITSNRAVPAELPRPSGPPRPRAALRAALRAQRCCGSGRGGPRRDGSLRCVWRERPLAAARWLSAACRGERRRLRPPPPPPVMLVVSSRHRPRSLKPNPTFQRASERSRAQRRHTASGRSKNKRLRAPSASEWPWFGRSSLRGSLSPPTWRGPALKQRRKPEGADAVTERDEFTTS